MCGRGRLRSQDVRGALIPPSPHAGGDACAPRTCVVRSFRLRRTRAGTPAHPGRAWCAHSAFAACGRGRPRSQVARGSVIPPSPHAGGDARAPRSRVVRSFRFRRMRARTPALPGRTWFSHSAFAARGRGRPHSQVARGSVIPPSPHAGEDARAPRSRVVRSFRFRRTRAGTPALPGCTWFGHSAFAACGRGRPRSQDAHGALIPPSLHTGGDARAPRLHVVRSFRLRCVRAGTPALPGRAWCAHSAFAACGRGRPCTQDARGAIIPPSLHTGGDARAPRTRVVRSFRLRCMRARTPALPGRAWCGHSAFAAGGRGRPRSQVARGAVIPPSPHAGEDARTPSIRFNLCENCYRPARRLVRPRRWSSQIEPSRLRRWRDHADHRVTRTPTVTLSAIAHRPSAIGYQSSAIGYRLSAIGYRRRSALSSGR